MNQPKTSSIRFEYLPSLPKLAWCATLRKGCSHMLLECGSQVEQLASGFAAGAWDADFLNHSPDEANTLIGSAGRSSEYGYIFCPPTHTFEWLQLARVGDAIYVSNSMPMLMAKIGACPSLDYPDYYFDMLNMYRQGLLSDHIQLPTSTGTAISLYLYHSFVITADLKVLRKRRDIGNPPLCYEQFREHLQDGVDKLFANAQDIHRKYPFQIRSTLSRGYDSVSTATIAAQSGCREALTFSKSGGSKHWGHDSGAEIGRLLGMEVYEYNREDLNELCGLRDHEFYLSPLLVPTDRALQLFDDRLENTVLITGRGGDYLWSILPYYGKSHLQRPRAFRYPAATLIEYSLRRGFLHFPISYVGARHAPILKKIALSKAMSKWRVGGKYDRPIQRRIAEEAGVPRDYFGVHKRGGHDMHYSQLLSQESLEDYEAYLSTIRGDLSLQMPPYVNNTRKLVHYILRRYRNSTFLYPVLRSIVKDRVDPLWRNRWTYTYHWALGKIIDNYSAAIKNDHETTKH